VIGSRTNSWRWDVNSRYVVLFLILVSLSITASAQRLDGTLRGTVVDPHGAVVTEAEVTVSNQATEATQFMKTTSTGEYVFPNLLVGTYTVEVKAKGFASYLRQDVEVLPNQTVNADARLTVGAPSEIVEVAGGGELVQTTTAQLSHDFGGRAVTDLPSPGLG